MLPEEPRAFRQVLIQLKLAASGAEADQKLKQGAVKVDGRKVNGPFEFQGEFLRRGGEHVVEVGRRAFLLEGELSSGGKFPERGCVRPGEGYTNRSPDAGNRRRWLGLAGSLKFCKAISYAGSVEVGIQASA